MAAVRRRDNGETVGMCGLVNRDSLDDIDIGYAFLPSARGKGYALEAAMAVMKMGMSLDSMIRLTPQDEEICLYL